MNPNFKSAKLRCTICLWKFKELAQVPWLSSFLLYFIIFSHGVEPDFESEDAIPHSQIYPKEERVTACAEDLMTSCDGGERESGDGEGGQQMVARVDEDSRWWRV
ncbi:hypothetical protein F2Q68_00014910 [Brassica cretica]|uniref:Uncharacterized protein n=1 Tax=Brassica cretica TaxID=69181 RepID=A0A8S9HHQ5_BRACR|nr:hypothetical protein F2Q68_00014910 [Brassica cretica]